MRSYRPNFTAIRMPLWMVCLALSGIATGFLGGPAHAEDRGVPEAISIPLRLPITGTRDTQVEAAILRQLERLRSRPRERGVLV